jgi:DNA polymerase V
MKAIIDCNSFYCSCERLFRPELAQKPVVVLSNNDGCIIARSDEAKALGVGMAAPYFQNKDIIKQHNVAVFSSNYNLYGDMSWRVMETLRQTLGPEKVEVYSVDEAFLDLDHVAPADLFSSMLELRLKVEMWTGIKVSIGVAPTKVLCKVANRLAKKNKIATQCVLVLNTPHRIEQALERTAVEDVWGVGFQYAQKLQRMNILTALQLREQNIAWARKNLGGVVGERLLRELKGQPVLGLKDELTVKKMIATTRMFGSTVTDLKSIKEAVATYASRAAEKLRRQRSAAGCISVFVIPKETSSDGHFRHGPTLSRYTILPVATSITHQLIKPALQLVEELYEPGRSYKKAGVLLSNIVPDNALQGNFFQPVMDERNMKLMDMLDNINFSQRNDILKYASSGTTRNWKMQQNFHSPRYTSRWSELYEIK